MQIRPRFLVVLISFLVVFPAVAQKKNRIFDDFIIMKAPRSNVPVGAIWTDIGPVGEGVSNDKLSVGESFQDFTSSTDQNLKTSLTGNIATYLQGTVKAELWSSTTINLESVKIVRVSSTDVLKSNMGNTILYEAVRADNVSFTIDKKRSAELKATLPKTFTGAEIISDTEVGSKRHIVAKGVNLYVAYRVVKLERSKAKETKVKFKSQFASGTNNLVFGNSFYLKNENFTITLCPCQVIGCANAKLAEKVGKVPVTANMSKTWLNECVASNFWTIVIADSKEIANGKPKETVINSKLSFDIWNTNYPLSTTIGSDGIEIKYLSIEHLFFDTYTLAEGYIVVQGKDPKVKIINETISFRNIVSKNNNGW